RRDGSLAIIGLCSCPVGRDCKHVAAVLVAAHREELAGGMPEVPPMTVARPEAEANGHLPFDLAGWLSTLHAHDRHESEDYPPSMHQRLWYVRATADGGRGVPALSVRPFTVRLQPTGKISHPRQYALQQTAVAPRYLRPSDRVILARLRRVAADYVH